MDTVTVFPTTYVSVDTVTVFPTTYVSVDTVTVFPTKSVSADTVTVNVFPTTLCLCGHYYCDCVSYNIIMSLWTL